MQIYQILVALSLLYGGYLRATTNTHHETGNCHTDCPDGHCCIYPDGAVICTKTALACIEIEVVHKHKCVCDVNWGTNCNILFCLSEKTIYKLAITADNSSMSHTHTHRVFIISIILMAYLCIKTDFMNTSSSGPQTPKSVTESNRVTTTTSVNTESVTESVVTRHEMTTAAPPTAKSSRSRFITYSYKAIYICVNFEI